MSSPWPIWPECSSSTAITRRRWNTSREQTELLKTLPVVSDHRHVAVDIRARRRLRSARRLGAFLKPAQRAGGASGWAERCRWSYGRAHAAGKVRQARGEHGQCCAHAARGGPRYGLAPRRRIKRSGGRPPRAVDGRISCLIFRSSAEEDMKARRRRCAYPQRRTRHGPWRSVLRGRLGQLLG